MYLDVGTGRIGTAGAGQTVFLSADGRYLLMSQTETSLAETPVAGGAARWLTLPRGWYLPGGDGLADVISGTGLGTADGVVVQSVPSLGSPGATGRDHQHRDPRGADDAQPAAGRFRHGRRLLTRRQPASAVGRRR